MRVWKKEKTVFGKIDSLTTPNSTSFLYETGAIRVKREYADPYTVQVSFKLTNELTLQPWHVWCTVLLCVLCLSLFCVKVCVCLWCVCVCLQVQPLSHPAAAMSDWWQLLSTIFSQPGVWKTWRELQTVPVGHRQTSVCVLLLWCQCQMLQCCSFLSFLEGHGQKMLLYCVNIIIIISFVILSDFFLFYWQLNSVSSLSFLSFFHLFWFHWFSLLYPEFSHGCNSGKITISKIHGLVVGLVVKKMKFKKSTKVWCAHFRKSR